MESNGERDANVFASREPWVFAVGSEKDSSRARVKQRSKLPSFLYLTGVQGGCNFFVVHCGGVMEKRQTVQLLLSKGVKIPGWIQNLNGVVITRRRIQGKRIRTIRFPKARAEFGQRGGIWLKLVPFRNSFWHFPDTLQIRDRRNCVIASNIYLCPKCFELSGGIIVTQQVSGSRVRGNFVCKNKDCTQRWTRYW